MARHCFALGIDLKRVEVIPDDYDAIAEAATRLSRTNDWVVTSGGIGPTPDDITYDSLARAFNTTLEYHDETIRRMDVSAKQRGHKLSESEDVKRARYRMALFPKGADVIFPTKEYWVPIVRVGGNVCILPGVPRIFEALLDAYTPYLCLDPSRPRPIRQLINCAVPESELSPLLERLTVSGQRDGIKVGSYPRWGTGVHISLIGTDPKVLERYTAEVVAATGGTKL
ncbi:hypothetical protein MCUN1_000113 [Malassezia cuniculi]|uniref:MoaB/Mog domain-containing protein n=1 Tax=Malassezia cuniculi TaxID=948313 RepID=A0AAF0J4Q7_9BASI|nr:hypothetical protein MCUN1_000113 [Malassezia cuniculi]